MKNDIHCNLRSRGGVRSQTLARFVSILAVLTLSGSFVFAQERAPVSIMTQNMDSGTDLGFALALGAPAGVDLTLLEVEASNLPQRADLLAARIAAEQPDLVVLEEATLWRIGPTPTNANQVLFDQLELLLDALVQHGVVYKVVTVNSLTDLALPGTTGALRYTDRDALLIRSELAPPALHLSDVHAHIFKAGLVFQGLPIVQGWLSADIHTGNGHFRLIQTHLETPIPGIPEATEVQLAQAAELLGSLRHVKMPVVLCGDFNSDAEFGTGPDATPTVGVIESAGYADVWAAVHPGDPGYTWPLYLMDQYPVFFLPSEPFERIDLFFSKNLQPVSIQRVLAPAAAGVMPDYGSDHAGVLATFQP